MRVNVHDVYNIITQNGNLFTKSIAASYKSFITFISRSRSHVLKSVWEMLYQKTLNKSMHIIKLVVTGSFRRTVTRKATCTKNILHKSFTNNKKVTLK